MLQSFARIASLRTIGSYHSERLDVNLRLARIYCALTFTFLRYHKIGKCEEMRRTQPPASTECCVFNFKIRRRRGRHAQRPEECYTLSSIPRLIRPKMVVYNGNQTQVGRFLVITTEHSNIRTNNIELESIYSANAMRNKPLTKVV